jgi:hypothetical protein
MKMKRTHKREVRCLHLQNEKTSRYSISLQWGGGGGEGTGNVNQNEVDFCRGGRQIATHKCLYCIYLL